MMVTTSCETRSKINETHRDSQLFVMTSTTRLLRFYIRGWCAHDVNSTAYWGFEETPKVVRNFRQRFGVFKGILGAVSPSPFSGLFTYALFTWKAAVYVLICTF